MVYSFILYQHSIEDMPWTSHFYQVPTVPRKKNEIFSPQICGHCSGSVFVGVPGSLVLQLGQEEEGDADGVLHLVHGCPHSLLGLVCLSQVWQGWKWGVKRGNVVLNHARHLPSKMKNLFYILLYKVLFSWYCGVFSEVFAGVRYRTSVDSVLSGSAAPHSPALQILEQGETIWQSSCWWGGDKKLDVKTRERNCEK